MGSSGASGGMSVSEQRQWKIIDLQNTERSFAMQDKQLEMQAEQMNIAKAQTDIAKQQLEMSALQITEPEKRVDSIRKAATDAARANELRRGLSSSFNRPTVGSGSSATAGLSFKLGR